MTITCYICCRIDPFRHGIFEEYGRNWLSIIPDYSMPNEGTDDMRLALIRFDRLRPVETCR